MLPFYHAHLPFSYTLLALLGILNAYFPDWQVRQKASTNVSSFVFLSTRIFDPEPVASFVSHGALRLTCNHAGYEPLWREQIDAMGVAWREPTPPHSWPVLAGDDVRWEVRTAIDAVVADAYGLSRALYVHVLSSFSHRSYPKAPELCLAKFDELKQIGLEAFTRKYDPYWDVPLNENLPEPIIELPGVVSGDGANGNGHATDLFGRPLPVNLFGEVETSGPKRSRRR